MLQKYVTNLSDYRSQKRRRYLRGAMRHLDKFIKNFIDANFMVSYGMIEQYFLWESGNKLERIWDYQELRDRLKSGIHKIYGEKLWSMIREQPWFDTRWISYDQVLEHCVSLFILEDKEERAKAEAEL